MRHTALCLARDQEQTDAILHDLHRAGFTADEISLLTGGRQPVASPASRMIDGVANGGHGAMIGAALGWMAGLGASALPGMGSWHGSGPLMAALGGAAVGAAVAGLGNALAKLGLPQPQAQRYEDSMRAGNTLITVHTGNGYEIETILDIFRHGGASHCLASSDPHADGEQVATRATAGTSRLSALFERAPRYA